MTLLALATLVGSACAHSTAAYTDAAQTVRVHDAAISGMIMLKWPSHANLTNYTLVIERGHMQSAQMWTVNEHLDFELASATVHAPDGTEILRSEAGHGACRPEPWSLVAICPASTTTDVEKNTDRLQIILQGHGGTRWLALSWGTAEARGLMLGYEVPASVPLVRAYAQGWPEWSVFVLEYGVIALCWAMLHFKSDFDWLSSLFWASYLSTQLIPGFYLSFSHVGTVLRAALVANTFLYVAAAVVSERSRFIKVCKAVCATLTAIACVVAIIEKKYTILVPAGLALLYAILKAFGKIQPDWQWLQLKPKVSPEDSSFALICVLLAVCVAVAPELFAVSAAFALAMCVLAVFILCQLQTCTTFMLALLAYVYSMVVAGFTEDDTALCVFMAVKGALACAALACGELASEDKWYWYFYFYAIWSTMFWNWGGYAPAVAWLAALAMRAQPEAQRILALPAALAAPARGSRRHAMLMAAACACATQLIVSVWVADGLCQVREPLANFELYWARSVTRNGPRIVYWCIARVLLATAGAHNVGFAVDLAFIVPHAFSQADGALQDVCPDTQADAMVTFASVPAVERAAAVVVLASVAVGAHDALKS